MKPFLTLAASLAIGAAALTPLASHASHAQGVAYTTIQYGYDSGPRYEHPRHARRGFVWQPGHWERYGHRNVWVEGQWLRVRPSYGYGGGYGNGYRMGYGRDLDRDGIPDARDRDLDNDGVPNWHDRDRDGDGIPNEYDRRPDNRYR